MILLLGIKEQNLTTILLLAFTLCNTDVAEHTSLLCDNARPPNWDQAYPRIRIAFAKFFSKVR